MTDNRSRDGRRIPALEWVAAAIGLVIVSAILAFLLIETLRTDPDIPPMLSIAPVRLVSSGNSYVLEVEVANSSRQTAAAVQVQGTLENGAGGGISSTATLNYVPGKSTRTASLVFGQDPRQRPLDLRVTGFERP